MKIFYILLLQIFAINLSGQKRVDVQFMMEGHLRQSILSIPSHPAPAEGYPMVLMLHGTGQDGQEFYDNSGWKELGESENFIAVFPTSLEWCFTEDGMERKSRRWVCGGVTDNPCSGTPQDYVNDVNYLKKLVQIISDSISINKSMIFASGFSNGSGMIHKLAVEAGDVFAACAGSGAFLTRGDSANPVLRIPVWVMMGTNDDRHIVDPFTSIPYGEDSAVIYFRNSINRMLGCQGLTQDFKKTETVLTKTYDFTQNQPGENSELYRFTIINGMYHVYPNGNNFPLQAARLFWEFFKRSVTVGSEQSSSSNHNFTWTIHPNPANGPLKIKLNRIAEKIHWELMDAYGRILRTGNLQKLNAFQVDNTEGLQGIHFLQVHTELGRFTEKIQFYKE